MVDVKKMWNDAGADKTLVVACPHAKHTVSTVTSLNVGVRTSADLMNLGCTVRCSSIADAIQAEYKFFSIKHNVKADVFVDKLGYTVARGILRSIFSEHNPKLFYEFLRCTPKDTFENVYTILVKPFSLSENGVYSADMIGEAQVKAILQDHRLALSKHMTVQQQYALLHVQKRMQRQLEELKEQQKIDADREKIVKDRNIKSPAPFTSRFKPTPKKPKAATSIMGGYSSFLRGETPLIAVGDANTVVVPLGVPAPTPATALPSNTASMSFAPSTNNVSIVATGKKMTKSKKKKKSVPRSRAKPKKAKKAASANKTKIKTVRPKLYMLASDEEEEKIDSAAKLAVSPLSRKTPSKKTSAVKANHPPPPKLVRQTNKPVTESNEDIDSAAKLAVSPLSRKTPSKKNFPKHANYPPPPELKRQTNKPVTESDEDIDSAAKLALSPLSRKKPRKPRLLMLAEDDDIPPPPKLVRQTNLPAVPPAVQPASLANELSKEMRPVAKNTEELDATAKPKVKKRRSRATRKKTSTKKSANTDVSDTSRDAKRRKMDGI